MAATNGLLTVVVVDDQPAPYFMLRASCPPHAEVVATFASYEDFLERYPATKLPARDERALELPGSSDITEVDVVMMDMHIQAVANTGASLQGVHAIRAVARLSKIANPKLKLLLYTSERRPVVLANLIAAGAHGVVHKNETPEAVWHAVTSAHLGDPAITVEILGLAEVAQRFNDGFNLSRPKARMLGLRAQGVGLDLIAERTGYAYSTVSNYLRQASDEFVDFLHTVGPLDGVEATDDRGSRLPLAEIARHLGLLPGDLFES